MRRTWSRGAILAVVIGLGAVGALGGCRLSGDARSSGSPPAEVTPEQDPGPATPAAGAGCDALKDQFRARLAAGPGTCETDGDCSVAPGGIEGGGCGTVTDRATADELYALYERTRTTCGLDFECGPQVIFTGCRAGRCVEVPFEPLVPSP